MKTGSHPARPPVSEQSAEADLIARAIAGETAAFERIMRRYNQKLFRTARSILMQDADAEDAVQETYLRAWRELASFRSDASLSTWLVRIAVNESLGRLRRRSAQVIPLDAAMNTIEPEVQASLCVADQLQPESGAIRAQLRTLLETRIDRLPEVFRTVFILRMVEEMTVEEVAESLGIQEATVRTRLFRARSLLREGLASDLDLTLGEVFSFDGARCDRIVAGVLARIEAGGIDR